MSRSRSRKRLLKLSLVALLTLGVAVGYLAIRCSLSPAGLYRFEGMSRITYLLLQDGKVLLTEPDDKRDISDRVTDTGGTYFKTADGWVSKDPQSRDFIVLKSTLFGLRMSCTNISNPAYNTFYPRRGFGWARKWDPVRGWGWVVKLRPRDTSSATNLP